jgi:hypothetical protein
MRESYSTPALSPSIFLLGWGWGRSGEQGTALTNDNPILVLHPKLNVPRTLHP